VRKLTSNQKKELDKESQVFKCLVCDEQEVRWNGQQWECGSCHFLYNGMVLSELIQ